MFQTLEEYIISTRAQIPLVMFVMNLLFTAILSWILSLIYTKYGNSLSNRKQFGNNFYLISTTTMLIIAIVKSSLALSLGLVGALSIIRFRAAIKEPEELAYLFLTIGLGLGFGADQGIITFVAFGIITCLIILSKRFSNKISKNPNLLITISSKNPELLQVETIIKILSKHCRFIELRRLDEEINSIEISILIEAYSFHDILAAKNELLFLENEVKFTLVDNIGIF